MDLTAPIFDTTYIYPCTIPYICTLNKDEVAEFGMRSTRIPELDKSLDMHATRVWLTIDAMIEIYKQYYPIRITDLATAKTVYETIISYTEQWRAFLSSPSLNRRKAPLEDLILMEEFASRLRPTAADGAPLAPVERGLTNVLDGLLYKDRFDANLEHREELLNLFKDYKSRGY